MVSLVVQTGRRSRWPLHWRRVRRRKVDARWAVPRRIGALHDEGAHSSRRVVAGGVVGHRRRRRRRPDASTCPPRAQGEGQKKTRALKVKLRMRLPLGLLFGHGCQWFREPCVALQRAPAGRWGTGSAPRVGAPPVLIVPFSSLQSGLMPSFLLVLLSSCLCSGRCGQLAKETAEATPVISARAFVSWPLATPRRPGGAANTSATARWR